MSSRPKAVTRSSESLPLCGVLERKNPALSYKDRVKIKPGSVLLSHLVSKAVPSALEGLTSVFEMGTGVTLPPSPPGKLLPSTYVVGLSVAPASSALGCDRRLIFY